MIHPVPALADGRMPVVSNPFGQQSDGVFHPGADLDYRSVPGDPQGLPQNTGTGFVMPNGTPSFAAFDGVVKQSYDSTRGGWVLIDHGNGFETAHQHLRSRAVGEGDVIAAGTQVGIIGYDIGPGQYQFNHLHWEVHQDGQAIDPAPYLVDATVLPMPSGFGIIGWALIVGAGYALWRAVR